MTPHLAARVRTRVGGTAYRFLAATGRRVRKRMSPGRRRRPLYQGSALDDVLFAQPVNLAMRLARRTLARRSTRPGFTIIVVNYQTLDLLRTVLAALRRFSPDDTEIIVVDNASSDCSWQWLRSRPHGIRAVRLPVNVGHGRALDIGLFLARTDVIVTLDSDAFPYSAGWVGVLLEPLRDPDVAAAGCWGPRDRLHPACAAYRRNELLRLGLSFHNFNLHKDLGQAPVFSVNTWDTGELIFEALGRDRVVLLPTQRSDRGWGMVMAEVVYHHTGMTTSATDDSEQTAIVKAVRWQVVVGELLGSAPAA